MTTQVITVGFGKESFSTCSLSLSAFAVTDGFSRELVGKTYKRQGAVHKSPVSQHPDINGYLFLDTVEVPDGAIILLQYSYRYLSRPVRDAAVFLRTRATGPMMVVKAALAEAEEARLTGQSLVFQGRADVLDKKKLQLYDIAVPRSYEEAYMAEDEVEDSYELCIVSPGIAPEPSLEAVTDLSGAKILLPKKAGRRVRIRK